MFPTKINPVLLFYTPVTELITSVFVTNQKAFLFINRNSALTFERIRSECEREK